MDETVRGALGTDRVIDITTTGRTSGAARRIEIWQHTIDGRTYLTGTPGPRGWYANVLAEPRFTLHLKGSVRADLPAVAHPVTDEAARREFFAAAFARMGRDTAELDGWVDGSPLIEVEFA